MVATSDACNHNCEVTEQTLTNESRHYLDCPVWKEILSRTGTQVGAVWPYTIMPSFGRRRRWWQRWRG